MRRLLLGMIAMYRRSAPARTPRCRYIPTCSQYAEEAITNHGAWRGGRLALRRLSRCHPLGSFGFDPVPPIEPAGETSPPLSEPSRGH